MLLSFMRHFGWAHVTIVSSHQDICLATAGVAMTLRTHGLPVGLVTFLGPGEQGAMEVLKPLCSVDGLKSKCMWVSSSYPSPDFTWLVFFLVSDTRLSP